MTVPSPNANDTERAYAQGRKDAADIAASLGYGAVARAILAGGDPEKLEALFDERTRTVVAPTVGMQEALASLIRGGTLGTIRAQVTAFHEAMGQPIVKVPAVPSDDRVRLRLRLIAEEFFELLDASLYDRGGFVRVAGGAIARALEDASVRVNLPEFADALVDIAYVVEGSNLELDIDGEKVLAEVQRSNMAKAGGTVRVDGKIQKPEGWTPPDVAGVLRAQGWDGK